jgi:hypothetical protein
VLAQPCDHRVLVPDEQAEEQVLGAEVVLVAPLGLLASEVGHDAGLFGESHPRGHLPGLDRRAAVLLVDGLLGHSQPAGDVLPGPALGSGVVDLQDLQGLDQAPEGGHRPQPQLRVAAAGRRQGRRLGFWLLHDVKVS